MSAVVDFPCTARYCVLLPFNAKLTRGVPLEKRGWVYKKVYTKRIKHCVYNKINPTPAFESVAARKFLAATLFYCRGKGKAK